MGTTKPRAFVQQASNGNTQLEAVECKSASMTCSPQTWAAQRSATHLRGEIALSACSSATFPSTPRPIPQRRTSNTWKPRFGASIELHIFEDYDFSIAPPVVLELMPSANGKKNHGLFAKQFNWVSCRDRIPWLDLPSVELLPKVEVSMVENDYPKPPLLD